MDFQAIRKEYEDQGIDAKMLQACPLEQLKLWLAEATEKVPGRWFESNVMALATCGKEFHVGVRYVLLKEIVAEGIHFFTNYDSAKGQQLSENPNCSCALHWPYLGRQVRISGKAEKTSREVSERYFHSRPRGAQISAAISPQSSTIVNRNALQSELDRLASELGDRPVPLPENWGGYLVRPDEFEFWQGRSNRLHDRIIYCKGPEKWVKKRLAP